MYASEPVRFSWIHAFITRFTWWSEIENFTQGVTRFELTYDAVFVSIWLSAELREEEHYGNEIVQEARKESNTLHLQKNVVVLNVTCHSGASEFYVWN